MTFQEELILLLIDKVALGALIGLVVLIASRTMERYRAKQALYVEIAKLRVAEISIIWKEYYRIIGEIEKIHFSAMGIELQDRENMSIDEILKLEKEKRIPESTLRRFKTELIPRIDKIKNDVYLLGQQMDLNRFWMGEKLHERHSKVWKNLSDYVHLMETDRLSEKDELSVDLHMASYKAMKLREDIFTLSKYL